LRGFPRHNGLGGGILQPVRVSLVPGNLVSVFANPFVFRSILVLLISMMLIAVGALLFRYLRRAMVHDSQLQNQRVNTAGSGFAFQTYQGVISRLKEQEQELKNLREAASSRASASESLSVAVLTNLGSGVVVLNPAGIVQ